MDTKKRPLYFGRRTINWAIPSELSDFKTYGLWNSLSIYDRVGKLLEIVPAHDGDFFPESPFDHIELLREKLYSKKEIWKTPWPVRVDIDITQRCADNCYFCYSKQYALDSLYRNAEISLAHLDTIIKELAEGGTRSIRFTGGGEPLIHSEIHKILPMPKRYGLRSCIISNGNFFNEEINELLVSNIDHIRVSINSAKASTRQHLHKSSTKDNDLKKIFRQIRHIVQLRDALWPAQKRPLIWSTFLLLPENINEIYQAAQIMRDSGVDSISFRPLYHKLSRPFYDQELKIIHAQLESALRLHLPPTFNVFIPRRDMTTVWNVSPKTQFPRCISCHLRTIIEATNQGPMIKVCGLHRGTSGENLGILRDGIRFSKLWNSKKTEEILSNRINTCDRCIDISMNITLNKICKVLAKHPKAIFRKSWQRISEI